MQPGDAHRMLKQRRLSPAGPRRGHEALPSILVAERDPFSADLWEYFLRTEGYAVRVALHAEEPSSCWTRNRARLAVIDLLISGGAGLELCRFVREHLDIPVVAVSVLDSRDQALESGADAFLPKPLDHLRFVSTVQISSERAYLHSRVEPNERPAPERLASARSRPRRWSPVDAINLIIGRPGTGKTILAQQYLFRNATKERPALYLSTVSEPLERSSAMASHYRFSTKRR